MKTFIKFLFFIPVLFAVSCSNPTDMLTVINSNGSCYREFTEDVDSAFMVGDTSDKHNPFVVNLDSTWKVTWEFRDSELSTDFPLKPAVYDSIIKSIPDTLKANSDQKKEASSDNRFKVHIRRNFQSVQEMATEFKLKKSHEWSDLKVKYSLDKKFRWFYTYYTYKESYPKIETNFELPLEKFMTKDEAQFWFTGEPNLLQGKNGLEIRECVGSIEDKYNQWYAQNIWNAEYKVLLANYDKIGKQPVKKELLTQLKDSIYSTNSDPAESQNMVKVLNKFFKTKAFSTLWEMKDSPMVKFESDFQDQGFLKYFPSAFTYNLKMPGKILQSNNAIVKGDVITWTLTAYRMIYDDYTIEAKSCKANVWAFIVTGMIFALALGSFFYKPKKK